MIDHLKGEIYNTASNIDSIQEKWMANFNRRPWVITQF